MGKSERKPHYKSRKGKDYEYLESISERPFKGMSEAVSVTFELLFDPGSVV
ncbi:hypothetical protein MC7420_7327 [Coleofasciculus chthonoplastes PCC 7420]|uniref:Uncharacterized protein n=1 Tax=Coleofasciculus chthonoplastes PCC 7420 TaxID=118168 RepID=B4VHT2_9CYAN|nr:hypothetical protein MC7420_7327 [Coleofasciculus chthonoplastes PCC 7420]